MAFHFPDISPIALSLGPIDIRWYALSYLAGFLLGLYSVKKLTDKYPSTHFTKDIFDDLLTWIVIGVILGGRLGYVLFYNASYYLSNPLDALQIWHGGMSFHGGLIGVILAMILFARVKKIPFFALSDRVAVVTPIGLFFGRLANFINAELYGRATDAPWGVIFPQSDVPRHPSQLYEAVTEGAILFVILAFLLSKPAIREKYGIVSGLFLCGYGFMRFLVEFTREPDAHIGFLAMGLSMGQWLCVPMILIGLAIIIYAYRKSHATA